MLVPQLERAKKSCETLQASLNEVLPQLVGLLEFIAYLITTTKGYDLDIYPIDYDAGKASSPLKDRLKSCTACQAMFKSIAKLGGYGTRRRSGVLVETPYGYNSYFNEKIIQLLPKLMNLQDE